MHEASSNLRARPFGALVALAIGDAQAAGGLALAYGSLPPVARRRLVDAIVEDAASEGVAPASVLASLLAVENDPETAAHLFGAMTLAGPEGLAHRAEPKGWAGDDAAAIAIPLYGEFVELIGLVWDAEGRVQQTCVEPLLTARELAARVSRFGGDSRLAAVRYDVALDAMVQALWTHRRAAGSMPDGLERFAAVC
ncbi:MAG: hypothetical protein KC417_03250 [Myxococcales bacterium]|nr:hypothetical protein [Myxococcales bacterium]